MTKEKPVEKPDLANVNLVEIPAKAPDSEFDRRMKNIHDRFIWPSILSIDCDTEAGPVVHALLTAALTICLRSRHGDVAPETVFLRDVEVVLDRAEQQKQRHRMNELSGATVRARTIN